MTMINCRAACCAERRTIVAGVGDRLWGQVVTAIYIKKDQSISTTSLQTAITDKLSKYKQPKHWIAVESIPRSLQGKINYSQVTAIAREHLKIV